jgi:hypothetical protein
MTDKPITLQPCPFCGSAPELHKDKMLGDAWLGCMNKECTVAPYIESPDLSERGGEASAVEAWNKRALNATAQGIVPDLDGKSTVAERVVCERCGHENWIMEGKAPCQITESDKRAAAPTAPIPAVDAPSESLLQAIDYAIQFGWPFDSHVKIGAIRAADKARAAAAVDAVAGEPSLAVRLRRRITTYGYDAEKYGLFDLPLDLLALIDEACATRAVAGEPVDEVELIAKHIEENWKFAERDPRDIAKDIRTLILYYRSVK